MNTGLFRKKCCNVYNFLTHISVDSYVPLLLIAVMVRLTIEILIQIKVESDFNFNNQNPLVRTLQNSEKLNLLFFGMNGPSVIANEKAILFYKIKYISKHV